MKNVCQTVEVKILKSTENKQWNKWVGGVFPVDLVEKAKVAEKQKLSLLWDIRSCREGKWIDWQLSLMLDFLGLIVSYFSNEVE